MRLRIVTGILAAAAAIAGSAGFEAGITAKAAPDEGRTGNVVVRFKLGAGIGAVAGAISMAETTATASNAGSGFVLVTPEPGQSVDDAIAALEGNPDVLFAEPERTVTLAATPNDPYYGSTCVAGGTTLNPCQWHYPQINMPAAWDTETGSTSVVIAVVDTGVQTNHPDLDSKIVAGYDFVNSDSNTNDDNGHGTFVAGIIAAETNNSSWVAGVCWACRIMPVKVLGAQGQGTTYGAAAGINFARSNGAEVINLSLAASVDDPVLHSAITDAYLAGVVVVAASGNDNGPVKYPAAYDEAIAVGANNRFGNRSSFSNYGPQLDVMAPGETVVSTVLGGGFGAGSGTSFAAPHVAGVAGLMISAGITNNATVAQLLKTTATNMGSAGFDNLTGWGRVNAASAIDATPPAVSLTAPANGATISGTSVALAATASDASGIAFVRFWVDGTSLGYDGGSPYQAGLNSTLFSSGPHTLKAQAVDRAGNEAWSQISVTIDNGDEIPPVVNITSPANGATLSGATTISATATDAGGIERVRFWTDYTSLGWDGTAPFVANLNTALYGNGVHLLKAQAIDRAGNETWTQISFTIDNTDNIDPAVSITFPAEGATISGPIVMTANAADAGGIERVRFWIDWISLGWDGSAPYAGNLNTALYNNGPHVLKAQAIDRAGNETWVQINVTIDN